MTKEIARIINLKTFKLKTGDYKEINEHLNIENILEQCKEIFSCYQYWDLVMEIVKERFSKNKVLELKKIFQAKNFKKF